MKLLTTLTTIVFSLPLFAASSVTIRHYYDYKIDYEKVKANVICLDVKDNGDDTVNSKLIWFSEQDYQLIQNLKYKGFTAQLNSKAGEQCKNHGGSTPSVTVYAYSENSIYKNSVQQAMENQGKSFVQREILFTRSTYNQKDEAKLNEQNNNHALRKMWQD